jgi:hypothetical protein
LSNIPVDNCFIWRFGGSEIHPLPLSPRHLIREPTAQRQPAAGTFYSASGRDLAMRLFTVDGEWLEVKPLRKILITCEFGGFD